MNAFKKLLNTIWSKPILTLLASMSMFLSVMALRILVEKSLYVNRWVSFWLGDSLCLPQYAIFVSLLLKDEKPNGALYRKELPIIIGCLVGAYFLYAETNAVRTGFRSLESEFDASQLWHTIFAGPYASFLASRFLPAVTYPFRNKMTGQQWIFWSIAMMGLIEYAATFVYDGSTLQDHSDMKPPYHY